MNKAVFLDRDGVITIDKVYAHKIEDFQLMPYAVEGLQILQNTGYGLMIVTNQSGIGRGFYTERDYFSFRNHLYKELKKNGVKIYAEYFCPHHPDENCNCRKPKTGMFERAVEDFNLDLKECWMIGDSERDIQAGKNAGCKTIHILTGKQKESVRYADFVAKDLIEAADYILNQIENKNK